MKKLISLALALCLAVSLFAGCGSASSSTASPSGSSSAQPSTEDLPTLRVAVMPLITSLPVKYVMENGLDVERGFRIEPLTFDRRSDERSPRR